MKIQIRKANIEEVFLVSQKIPEFKQSYPKEEYKLRLENVVQLILIAEVEGEIAGFKVGYARDDYFYSWMGGVLPKFRKIGVAKALAVEQETWAKKNNFNAIQFKTWNQHKAMLIFSLKNGFDIIALEKRKRVADYRIILEKKI